MVLHTRFGSQTVRHCFYFPFIADQMDYFSFFLSFSIIIDASDCNEWYYRELSIWMVKIIIIFRISCITLSRSHCFFSSPFVFFFFFFFFLPKIIRIHHSFVKLPMGRENVCIQTTLVLAINEIMRIIPKLSLGRNWILENLGYIFSNRERTIIFRFPFSLATNNVKLSCCFLFGFT